MWLNMAVRNVNIGSVKGMRSDWGAGDNLQIFNEQFKISKGKRLGDEAAMREAAQKTKTGEWAEEAGFRRVNIEACSAARAASSRR